MAVLTTAGITTMQMARADQSEGSLSLAAGRSKVVPSDSTITDGVLSAAFAPQTKPGGGGLYLALWGRVQDTNAYVAKMRILGDGAMRISILRRAGGVERALNTADVPGTFSVGSTVQLQLGLAGAQSTKVQARAWLAGTPMPDWQITAQDAESVNPGSGTAALWGYASSSGSTQNVSYSGFSINEPGVSTVLATLPGEPTPPTASATETVKPSAAKPSAAQPGTAKPTTAKPSATTTNKPTTAGAVKPSADVVPLAPATAEPPAPTASETAAIPVDPAPTTAAPVEPAPTTSKPTTAAPVTKPTTAEPKPTTAEPKPSTVVPEVTEPTPVTVTNVAAGGGRPGSGNTGVPSGTSLKAQWGDLTITKSGTVIDAMDVHGSILVKANNVTIKRTRVRGEAGSNKGLIHAIYGASNLVIEDSELIPDNPSVTSYGIKGWNFTARRVEMAKNVDSVQIFGDNVRVENSWLHQHITYAADPYQGNRKSHNDGVQILKGRNISLVGNTVTDASNAAVQVTQDQGATANLKIANNFFDNGSCSIKMNHKVQSYGMGPVTISDNRFGRGQSIGSCAMLRTSKTDLSEWSNVWDNDGKAVKALVDG